MCLQTFGIEDEQRKQINWICVIFCIVGLFCFVFQFVQVYIKVCIKIKALRVDFCLET